MNPVSNASLYQCITPPPEAGKENEGTGLTEEPSASRTGRHSVSLAAEGNTLSIASAEQGAGVTETATLSHRETVQKEKAASEMAPATSVNRAGSEQTQLQRESETVVKLEKTAANPEGKSVNEDQHQAMLQLIYDADDLMDEYAERNGDGNPLRELDEMLEPVFEYVDKHNDDVRVARELYRCKAYALCSDRKAEEALVFFRKSEGLPEDPVNLPERLFIMQLMLGMDIVTDNCAFHPEDFYKELEKWSRIDKTESAKAAQLLKAALETDYPGLEVFLDGVKLFRDGARALFEEKNINAEASEVEFEQLFVELARYGDGDQPMSPFLNNLDHMLKFARNLMLIEHGFFDKALESARNNESGKLEHLNNYICCRALEGMRDIDGAVKMCRLYTSNGYPFFSNYLETLESLRK